MTEVEVDGHVVRPILTTDIIQVIHALFVHLSTTVFLRSNAAATIFFLLLVFMRLLFEAGFISLESPQTSRTAL